MTRRTLAIAVIALCGTFQAVPGHASTLYAVNFSGTTPLYTVDQVTGAASVVGGTLSDIGDLTSDGVGRIWGVSLPAGSTNNDLVQIDPLTGNTVNTVAISGTRAGRITSLAYDPVTGVLFGNTTPGFGDADGDDLYTIDPVTGAATPVGSIGFNDVFALGFDQAGNLFGVADSTNELIGINTGSGAGALIAGLQLGLLFDIASRPEDNVMFAIDSGTATTYTLDTSNGNLTGVGAWAGPSNLVGLAFASVPEPTTLALLGLALAALGLIRRKKSR
jgi:hypothetical protein